MSRFATWRQKSPTLGATLVVMGTCVGAGTLGLPVGTAPLGFWGTLLVIAVVWWFMYYAGLLVLEVASFFRKEASYLTMAKAVFGPWVGRLLLLAFLALLYTLLAAYFVAGSDLTQAFVHVFFGADESLPIYAGSCLWALVGAVALCWGMRSVDYINRLCIMGLISAMLAMLFSLSIKADVSTLLQHTFHPHLLAFPLVMLAFGYQVVVPSVRQYLKGDRVRILFALCWGTLIPAVIYLLWCIDIFAILPPTGSHSLLVWASGAKPAYSLPLFVHKALDHAWFSSVVTSFVFFAIASSFLGMLMSLYDLLTDAFSFYKPTRFEHAFLIFLVLLPPLIYALLFHDGFMVVLQHGSVLVALLNGVLPAIMALKVRQMEGEESDYRAPGGSWMLALSLCFFLSVLAIAVFK